MPRFFFHLRTSIGLEFDKDGVEFPDLNHAYQEVCRAIPDLAEDFEDAGDDPANYSFQIANADGAALTEIPFHEVLAPRGPDA